MIPTRSQAPGSNPVLFCQRLRDFLNLQFSPASAARIFARIGPALARISLSAIAANEQIPNRQRSRRARQRSAMACRPDPCQQRFELRVAVPVASALQVKMIMAQFMLDDRLGLCRAMHGQLMRADREFDSWIKKKSPEALIWLYFFVKFPHLLLSDIE